MRTHVSLTISLTGVTVISGFLFSCAKPYDAGSKFLVHIATDKMLLTARRHVVHDSISSNATPVIGFSVYHISKPISQPTFVWFSRTDKELWRVLYISVAKR